MLFKIYDPEGKLFEVPAERAKELMALDWTPWHPNNPPTLVKSAKKKASEDKLC